MYVNDFVFYIGRANSPISNMTEALIDWIKYQCIVGRKMIDDNV